MIQMHCTISWNSLTGSWPDSSRFFGLLIHFVPSADLWLLFPEGKSSQMHPFCVTLTGMGSKDKGKKEVKKAPKPKPKPEPGRKREGFSPASPK